MNLMNLEPHLLLYFAASSGRLALLQSVLGPGLVGNAVPLALLSVASDQTRGPANFRDPDMTIVNFQVCLHSGWCAISNRGH